jgi:PKD repeat protein
VKPPVADFNVTVDGLTVSLANRTKGATSWSWTFGDGTSSTARNPTHTYAAAGTYTIRLVATGDGGTDSTSRTVTVGG